MKKILIFIFTLILMISLIGPTTALAESPEPPIKNGSFEDGDYTDWTLRESAPVTWGTWGIAVPGETINSGDSKYDYYDAIDVNQNSPGLPITYWPSDGVRMAYQLQNGPGIHRMYQDVTLPDSPINLKLDMFYINHAIGGYNPSQYLAIHIRELDDTLLDTLYITDSSKPQNIPTMTGFTFDISNFKGLTVRIDVELNAQSFFFSAGFDNFVISAPPTADPNGPYSGTVGSPVAFDGSGSTDDGTIETYDWDFGDGSTGTGEAPTHTYTASGTYTVSLTVTDNDGETDTAATNADIIKVNVPPVANVNGPYTGTVGSPVAMSSVGSSDSDGTIDTYSWDFGDGNTSTDENPSHTYTASGTYAVSLMVTDNDGETGTADTYADIINTPPVADPNGPYSGTVGSPVAMSSVGSSDSDGTIDTYSWDFGDGNTSTDENPPHIYAAPGNYDVTLTVTDNNGAIGTAATNADIINTPPVADPNGPYAGSVGSPVLFDGSGSLDPDGTITAYAWDFGDGGTSTEPSPSHTYAAPGNYDVTLTVTDNNGATGSATTNADIAQLNFEIEFNITEAKIEFKKKDEDDRIDVKGTLALSTESDDVSIFDDIIIQIGGLSETIPGGTIVEKKHHWEYKRSKGSYGIIKDLKIDWKKGKFSFKIDRADITGLDSSSVEISLMIGNDIGEQTIEMKEKKKHWEYKQKKAKKKAK